MSVQMKGGVMYLFDTDTISNVLKRRPSEALLQRLESVPADEQFISAITVAEIVYGAMKSEHPKRHLNNLDNILLPAVNVINFDSAAAFQAGCIRAELEKSGQPLSFTDIQIAAIAISHNMLLVTGNLRHFKRIKDLRVENWM